MDDGSFVIARPNLRYVVDLDHDKFVDARDWEFFRGRRTSRSHDLREEVFATPAIADNRLYLYIRARGALQRFKEGAESLSNRQVSAAAGCQCPLEF